MAKSKHRRKQKPRSGPPSARNFKVLAGLQMANEMMQEGEMVEARKVLEGLHNLYPSNTDVLQNLAYVCHKMGDLSAYLSYCKKLAHLLPDDAEKALALATAYAINYRPMLAFRTYRRFLAQWPEHEEADRIRETVAHLEAGAQEMLADAGLVGEDGLETLATHEEIQVMLADGHYEEGEALANRLLATHPQFAPAHNNLSQMLFQLGRAEEAIAIARQVLSFAPDNFQATGSLARFLFLSGRQEEAVLMADKLRSLQSDNPDFWIKQAETFSFMGDDEAVLAAFRKAEQAGTIQRVPNPALIYHLAAVASLRLGRESDARQHWKEALSLAPGLDLARENLADLNKPVGERHGPWAYDLGYWLPRRVIEDFIQQAKGGKQGNAAFRRAVEGFLQARADLRQLIPLLLERSDANAAGLVLTLASVSQNPELLEAVKTFALGQRGSDQLRFRAAQLAVEAGLLAGGEVRMWSQGKQQDLILLKTEINGDPEPWNIPPQARRLAKKAMEELNFGNGLEAEPLLNRALALAPGDIRLRNNLAASYKLQGRKEEYRQIVEQIHTEDPDYFFGRIQMAQILIERGQTEEAAAMLKPLSALKKVHFSEMAALCSTHIELALKEGRRDAARSWLDIFERVYPDHHNLEILRARVEKPRLGDLLKIPFGR